MSIICGCRFPFPASRLGNMVSGVRGSGSTGEAAGGEPGAGGRAGGERPEEPGGPGPLTLSPVVTSQPAGSSWLLLL